MFRRAAYRLRVLALRLDPRRGRRCDDLDCKCASCTTPGCECSGIPVQP